MSAADGKTSAKVVVPEILSAKFLKSYDQKLMDDKKWAAVAPKYEAAIASDAAIEKTRAALTEKKYKVSVVDSPAAALALLTSAENLPQNASVAFGGSITLEEVGFINAVKARGDLKNYRAEAFAAMAKGDYPGSSKIRTDGMNNADYFYSSVTALTEDGVIVSADASGTRVGPLTHGAKLIVLVVGANKIVPDLNAGLARLEEYVVPIESAHMREAYKIPGTALNNLVVIKGSMAPQRFHIVLIKGHSLGY